PERVTPYFCRVLRSSLEVDLFFEHLAAVRGAPGGAKWLRRLGLRSLADQIARDRFRHRYADLAEELNPPVPGLRPFFENLLERYGGLRARFKLVLVFGQFEEIFPRFVDAGPVPAARDAGLPNWRLRWEFFEELGDLFTGAGASPAASPQDDRGVR